MKPAIKSYGSKIDLHMTKQTSMRCLISVAHNYLLTLEQKKFVAMNSVGKRGMGSSFKTFFSDMHHRTWKKCWR